MENSRSKGVTIFAYLIIIGSFIGLFSQNKINPIASIYFYYIVFPLSIIAAIFLLRLKDWARKAVIIISISVAVETIATASYCLNKVVSLYGPEKKLAFIIAVFLSLIFNFAVIYFFTRPSVQKQFS